MEAGRRNAFHRLVTRIAATRFGGWLVLQVLTRIDPLLMRISKGRVSTGRLAGNPALLLTTTGARSGLARTVPLLYTRDGDHLVLIASATGIKHHPAWYHNLRKHPQVEVYGEGIAGIYIAREAEGDERERLWKRAAASYAGYDAYQRRAAHRRIPVIVLEPIRGAG